MTSTVNHECDIGFSSEIYSAIHQFGNVFFLNRMSFKRKQALLKHNLSERIEKEKKAISESTVNSQLKLEAIKTTLSAQGTLFALELALSLKTRSFTF